MKVIKEINNVLDYILTSDQCVILNSEANQIDLLDGDFNKVGEFASVENQKEILHVNSSIIVVKDISAQLHFFNFSDLNLELNENLTSRFSEYKYPFHNQLCKNELDVGTHFILSKKNKETNTKEVFQIAIENDYVTEWKFESEGLKFINGNFYDFYVTKYNGGSGQLLWRTKRMNFASVYVEDFNTRGDVNNENITKLIGVHNDTLWISLTSGRLVGLNDESGEIKYQLSGESCDFSKIDINGIPKLPMHSRKLELDKSTEELFTITGTVFVRMDLKNSDFFIDYQKLKAGINDLEMEVIMGRIAKIPFDDKYYYVINILNNYVGKLDKSNLKFEEIIDLGKDNGLIIDFRLYRNKLYVRNDNSTLKIISLD